ncbi:MAG: pyridoxine 5'-phosphate synthase [Candidatus Omnitrophica bacterium]|nr:pyridoxine 5'-phosphate synthase [Candidatus Omnitrophota bacterium]MDD5653636.1 pyridoxine 5'-phosphate synthase [Candidatus Omnitrophota bacterium]
MPELGVNVDHIATLRQARKGKIPDPAEAALICEKNGADSIVAHLREDRRHINEGDLVAIKKKINIRFNLEMSIAPEIVGIAAKLKPGQATLVPEKRQELTTEGGLDVAGNLKSVSRAVEILQKKGIEVSLFIDPERKQINAAVISGAKIIELHTGRYADAQNKEKQEKYFQEIRTAVDYALGKGLVVNAGHGLDYQNVSRIARVKGIEELNIGYSIICRAVFVGLERAVREMKALCV